MADWIGFLTPSFLRAGNKKFSVPEGVWLKCPKCKETLYSKDLIKSYKVCLSCQYHFRLTPQERLEYFVDEGSFQELFDYITSKDPLGFEDRKPYMDRLKQAQAKTGEREGLVTGVAKLQGKKINIAILDFNFMGGSMGSVVGEKLTRLIELAVDNKYPLVVFSASGGARMQEGILSLMQMAKTSIALNLLAANGIAYISVLANPTMGGVSASFATLGDVVLAEPGAIIGFAGQRVIKQTILQDLPENFQSSEFLLEHGGVDRIVHRHFLRKEVSMILHYLNFHKSPFRSPLDSC